MTVPGPPGPPGSSTHFILKYRKTNGFLFCSGPPGVSVMGQKGEPGMDSRSPFYGDLTHSAGRVGKSINYKI